MKLFNWRGKKQPIVEQENPKELLEDFELDDEEFMMAEEILGYDSCGSYTKQSCMNDCASNIAMPTITTLN